MAVKMNSLNNSTRLSFSFRKGRVAAKYPAWNSWYRKAMTKKGIFGVNLNQIIHEINTFFLSRAAIW
jgi:hypothetical protein